MDKWILHFSLLLVLLGFVFFGSKKGEVTALLRVAEKSIEKEPDKALILLDSIQQMEELSEQQQALWCLLYTSVLDRKQIKHTSDSLIQIAVSYYEKNDLPERKMQAYYYYGIVLQDLNDAIQAQDYYLRAYKLGIELERVTATSLLASCVVSLALFTSCAGVEQNTLTPEEVADGWQLLFDGKTLNGWKDYNGTTLTQPWHVVDGCIQAKGDGSDASGYIVTDKQYENFELSWDWKLSKGGNSGMLYHVVERPQFAVPYVTGPEYQLIDEPNFPEPLEEWQKLGVDYAMHLPDKSKMKVNPQGEWNNSKIVFDNGHVEHWLNGQKILEFEAWTDDWYEKKNSGKWANAPEYGLAKKGVLCLQDHGYPASFRNIKIKELPRKSKEVNLFNGVDLKGWEAYGTELWYVKDGLLICESGPDKKYGYLATRDYYDDFDLTVEFKQEADGNSGVFIRSFIEEDVKVNGWQVEVAPKGHDTGGIYESYGRGWLIQIPDEKETILKEGDWNTMRIKVQGDNVQTWLNGEEMVNINDEKIGAGQGRIALQIHDGGGIKVLWRNLKLKTL